MSVRTDLVVTVYMDQRDITPWCRSVSWSQPDEFLEQTWSVTTHAWHLFDVNSRYDIYASYDPGNPRDTCVIRQGYVLPDQRMSVLVDRKDQPLITVNGKSYSSRSFRKTPTETLVLVPAAEGVSDQNMAREVLKRYDGPVGRVRVISNCWDLRRVVLTLARRAEFNADYWGPNVKMQPIIVPPAVSYWESILQLIEPYALEVVYSEWDNFLLFWDPVSRWYGRQSMTIPGDLIERIDAWPKLRKRPRRVIVKVPAWP